MGVSAYGRVGVSARLDIGAWLLEEKSICPGDRKDREGLAEISSRSRMTIKNPAWARTKLELADASPGVASQPVQLHDGLGMSSGRRPRQASANKAERSF
jgi:hypothetical protein